MQDPALSLLAFSEACLGLVAWDDAMDQITLDMGLKGCILLPVAGRGPGAPVSSALREVAERTYFGEGWHLRDERERGMPLLARTGVVVDRDFASEDEMRHHPYWTEFLVRADMPHFAGVSVRPAKDDWWCLALQRARRHEPFSPEELVRLQGFSRRASAVARSAALLAEARTRSILDALDAKGMAACAIDHACVVVAANRTMELPECTLLGPRRELTLDDRSSARLAEAVGELLTGAVRLGGPCLVRSARGVAYLATILRSTREAAHSFARERAVLAFEAFVRPAQPA